MFIKIKSTPLKQVLKYLPIVLLVLLVVYSFKGYEKHSELENTFGQQKIELQLQLDRMLDDYKKLSTKKKGLSRRLIKEMNRIISLKKSVKNLKKENYNLITKYTRKIVRLERENRSLFLQADSLYTNNQKLQKKNNTIKDELIAKTASNRVLLRKNKILQDEEKRLNEKVSDARIIKVGKISAIAVKENRRGKFKSTSKSKRTDAFKIKFDLPSNLIAKSGQKKILIQVLDEDKNVISPKGDEKVNKKDLVTYSDSIVTDYQNEKLNVVSLISVDRKLMNKGNYNVVVYVDGKISGRTNLSLR